MSNALRHAPWLRFPQLADQVRTSTGYTQGRATADGPVIASLSPLAARDRTPAAPKPAPVILPDPVETLAGFDREVMDALTRAAEAARPILPAPTVMARELACTTQALAGALRRLAARDHIAIAIREAGRTTHRAIRLRAAGITLRSVNAPLSLEA